MGSPYARLWTVESNLNSSFMDPELQMFGGSKTPEYGNPRLPDVSKYIQDVKTEAFVEGLKTPKNRNIYASLTNYKR